MTTQDHEGALFERLQAALLDAYPRETDLAQFVDFKLTENLAAIAGGKNLKETTYNLIIWAKSTGRLKDLVQAAAADRPKNQELTTLADIFSTWSPPVSGPSSPVSGLRSPVPFQLPPRAQHFTGRETEITWLAERLRPGKQVTVWASGGMGKTALAAETLYRLQESSELLTRFPAGVVLHVFYGRPEMAVAYDHIVKSFAPEERDVSTEAVRQVLSGREALLILDGAEEAADLPALLRLAGSCGVLVTTRRKKDHFGERLPLTPPPVDDAVDLLNAWQDGRVAADVAEAIVDEVGRLPLAVNIAARFLDQTGMPAAKYLEFLRSTPVRVLSRGEHREQSVEILLAKSVAQVSDTAQQALAVSGCLALLPFSAEVAAAGLGTEEWDTYEALGELVNYGLLLAADGRYLPAHALVHTYARRRMTGDGGPETGDERTADGGPQTANGGAQAEIRIPKSEIVKRLADYYAAFGEQEAAQGVAGFRRLDLERGHIVRVLEGCVEQEAWEEARQLVWAVEDYLDVQGYTIDRVQVLELGLVAARSAGAGYDEGAYLTMLGIAFNSLGQVTKSIDYYEQALEHSRQRGDKLREGQDLGNLGTAYSDLGQVERAIEYYQQALAIGREIGDRRMEGNHLGNLGLAYADLGQVERAIDYYQQALAIRREIGDKGGEGRALSNMAELKREQGNLDESELLYRQALAIAQEINDPSGEAYRLWGLGAVYYERDDREQAVAHLEQSLAIFERLKFPQANDVRKQLQEWQSPS